jgi:hypothetical protein
MIKTDGNSVSILYEKERKIKQKKSKNLKGISSSEDKDYDVSNINQCRLLCLETFVELK